ncbi:hypothetical protein V8E55_006642 [Tylopilus felleus]
MAPATWTTDEQCTFLKEWLVLYLTYTENKDYYHFWPSFFSAWFMRWPERSAAFPDIQDPLTAEQEAELGKSIESRKTQLQTWFRWRANHSRQGRIQKKSTSVFEQVVEGKKGCIRSEAELYNDLYYDECIKPLVDTDKKAGRFKTSGQVLSTTHAHAKHLLEGESKSVKAQIHEMYLLQKGKKKADEQPEGDTDLKGAIEDLPAALAQVGDIIRRWTGFAVSFICTRPDPSRNWEITSLSCHPDRSPAGDTFASLYPLQEENVLKAFQEFAELLFCE